MFESGQPSTFSITSPLPIPPRLHSCSTTELPYPKREPALAAPHTPPSPSVRTHHLRPARRGFTARFHSADSYPARGVGQRQEAPPEESRSPFTGLQHPSRRGLSHTQRKQPVSTHVNPLLFISCTAVYSPSQLSNPITYFITVFFFFPHVGFLK